MSTEVGWDEAKRLLNAALALDPAQRDPFLRRACQESFGIRQALAKVAPEQQEAKPDLAIAFEKLGNVQRSLGATDAAEVNYGGALAQF